MRNELLILQGKLLSKFIKKINLGDGSTWPGHIALKANPRFITDILKKSRTKIIFIIGTNGKTTTTTLLSHILRENNRSIIQNASGANLVNGIASAILLNSNLQGILKSNYAIFEVDENAFNRACNQITPDIVLMLNLFRDQLDRYGEINSIAAKWSKTLAELPASTTLILNADDPQIASLGINSKQKAYYFGLDEKGKSEMDFIVDSNYCPKCGNKLRYKKVYFSHLGVWECPTGDLTRPVQVFSNCPIYPLKGQYNRYNTIAAYKTAIVLGEDKNNIIKSLSSFKPAFGRQEKVTIQGKAVEIILAKNPASFNQTLETIIELKAKHVLLLLNDRIADGNDVSWIWDVNFEILKNKNIDITVSGERVYDLALRLKYADITATVYTTTQKAIQSSLNKIFNDDILYIIPTYTAMLDARKVLLGKKIL